MDRERGGRDRDNDRFGGRDRDNDRFGGRGVKNKHEKQTNIKKRNMHAYFCLFFSFFLD